MSVQSEIERISSNISAAYDAVREKGGSVPERANSANLPGAISAIPAGAGGVIQWEDIDGRPDLSKVSSMKPAAATLLANLWVDGQQVLSVPGVLEYPVPQLIFIEPDNNDKDTFYSAGISAKQGNDYITFYANSVPDEDIVIYIHIVEAAEVGKIELTGNYEWWSPHMTSNTSPEPYVASASSEHGSANRAYKAFDGDENTRYECDETKTPQYLQFDFGKRTVIAGISIKAGNSSVGHVPKAFYLEGSLDGENWKIIFQTDGSEYPNAPSYSETRTYEFLPKSYRYYRMTCQATYDDDFDVSVYEMEFYKLEDVK